MNYDRLRCNFKLCCKSGDCCRESTPWTAGVVVSADAALDF